MIRQLTAALVAGMFFTSTAWGAWPERPVRVIVPFPAGGATDQPARMLGERLSKLWQQSVIVENRPGAGGAMAASQVARATADGYTLLFPSGSVMTVNQFVYSTLPYDPDKDFAPISIVVSGPLVLVVPKDSPFRSVDDLIGELRNRPGKLTFGHAGIGSQSHIANEYFLQQAKVDAVGVPYKGDPPALVDMIGGRLDFSVISLGASYSMIKDGKLRALGVTTKDEIPQLPGVPSLGKSLPGFDTAGWFGLVAPAAVPSDVVNKIAQDVRTVLQEPQIRTQLETLGFKVVADTPQEMADVMAADRKRWEKLVHERKIQVQ